MSHAWYTRLEQGAEVRPTREVVDAIARALLLDDVERAYLRQLAGFAGELAPCAQPSMAGSSGGADELQELVDQFLPNPAIVLSDLFEYLAWNDAYVALFNLDPSAFDKPHRNILWSAFVEHPGRDEVDDYGTRLVANFRWFSAGRVGDQEFIRLSEDLSSASAVFRKLWDRGVVGDASRHFGLEHPRGGRINMKATWLKLGHQPAVLEVKTPLTPEDRSRLAELM